MITSIKTPKFRFIRFIYQEPLNEDHIGILTVNFEALRDGAIKAMRDNLLKKAGGRLKTTLQFYADTYENGIRFGFPGPNEAVFIYPILNLTGQSITIGNKTYHLGDLMPERKITRFIINAVAKDMGIDPKTITYEVEDRDTPNINKSEG